MAIARPSFSPICTAIEQRHLLQFEYNGSERVVIPCAHGHLGTNNEALRAHPVYGEGDQASVGFGKLFLIQKMNGVRVSDRTFAEPPKGYHRGDTAMLDIHCQL